VPVVPEFWPMVPDRLLSAAPFSMVSDPPPKNARPHD
jgi:hypothetical protein